MIQISCSQANHLATTSAAREVVVLCRTMSRILLGVICGLAFGAVDVGIMLPMSFPDKTAAILGAFLNRFAIGFVIGAVALPWPGWLVGLVIGLLLSLPDAIITKAYGPIIGFGALGGVIIGIIVNRFGR